MGRVESGKSETEKKHATIQRERHVRHDFNMINISLFPSSLCVKKALSLFIAELAPLEKMS